MPKAEFDNFEAKDMASIKKVSDRWLKMCNLRKEKRKASLIVPWKTPRCSLRE